MSAEAKAWCTCDSAAAVEVASRLNRRHLAAGSGPLIELRQRLCRLVKAVEGIPAIGLGNASDLGSHAPAVRRGEYFGQ